MERINVVMMAYHTEEIVEASIKSIYDFADEIVIGEGCWSDIEQNGSKDRTWELIADFPDPSKKINKFRFSREPEPGKYPFASEEHKIAVLKNALGTTYYNGDSLQQQLIARDRAFRKLKDKSGWLFIVDSDEVYPVETIKNIFSVIEEYGQVINSITLPGKNFYFGYKYFVPEFFQRVLKIPDLSLNPYMRRTCSLGWDGFKIFNVDIPIKLASFFHYCYVGEDRVREKLAMWNQDIVKRWFERHKDLWAGAEYDGRPVHLLDGINFVYSNYTLTEFKGRHPESMEKTVEKWKQKFQ